MKKLYFLLFTLLTSTFVFAQGLEDFTNSNATGSYTDGTFTGNNGVDWTYIQSRDGNGDANMSGINLPALMLRRNSSGSKITSSSIPGGIGDFSVKLYKGFTGAGDRQVELFVNGVSQGTSTVFDDFTEQTFSVTGINIPGNIIIEIVNNNAANRQIIIDDITWTGFSTSCGVTLGQATVTCNASTIGDNNDSVTINIPYTGSDAAITNVTTTSGGTVAGDDPSSVADGTITITGLFEGDAWDVALVGGDCGALSASGSVSAAECDPIPNTCFDLSSGPDLFELVTVATNSDMDVWTESGGTYSMNGFCGGGCAEQVETWLVFGPLDMTMVSDLALAFDAAENFGTTDLNISYTSAYMGCPSGTSWTVAQTISDAGSYSVDLSAASGTNVYIGVEYNDDGADGYSGWDLSNVSLDAFGDCPILGTVVPSDCALCDVVLQPATFICDSNTDGANNDTVTIEIPYSGLDNTIASMTTPGAVQSGDDPALVADGTIILTGLSEGDAWSITLNGGDCDGTMLSGTIPATECDPEIVVINEINADPSNNANGEGDANGDGVAEFDNDEFVEIYNTGTVAIDMENYTLEDASVRHIFPAGTILQPNSFITVFGGGTPTGIPGIVQVASEGGGVGLSNGGDTVTLRDNNGVEVTSYTYSGAGNNQSIGRNPDFTGPFVQHATIDGNGALFSPGIENDDPSLSTNEFEASKFSLYPNPTDTGHVTITSSNNDAINVQVFDILGKQIKNETLTNNTLNVSNLKSGIYLIKITQNNASTTKKLVIK